MLHNYLLLAFKNFRKQKLFSLINILGLAVGIACCLLIFLFILHEFSYDKFHKGADHIYRVVRVSSSKGTAQDIPYLSAPYATALLNDYPQAVEEVVRVSPDNDLITYGKVAFNEKKICLVDSNFFRFFSFKLLSGDPASVLRNPASVVMTASAARRYFGSADPVGKVVQFNKQMLMTVTGVAEDCPANSHLQFDMVVPLMNWRDQPWFNQWPGNSLFVYVKLNPRVNPAAFTAQLPRFMDKYMGTYYRENGFHMDLGIRPLKGIYFEGESPIDPVQHGSKKGVYIFMSIAVLILVIACINFMNLATARASDRSREVGIRKVLGAERRELVWQFIFESLLYASVAAVLAFLLLPLVMPAYTRFLGHPLPPFWLNGSLYLFLIAIVLLVGVLAGSYPAFILSGFAPIESLKGKLHTGSQGVFFRKALVVFQFGISVLLIISVTIVMKQMHFVRNTDLGFSKEQAMIVRLDNGPIQDNRDRFKRSLEADPAVASVSLMSGEPGGFHDMYSFDTEVQPESKLMFSTEFADFEYSKTLGLKIIAGRDFSPAFPTDSTHSVLVNRAAAQKMGLTPEAAVGKWVWNAARDSIRRRIIGVVENYHFTSLKETIAPLVISSQRNDRRLALVKLKTAGLQQAIPRFNKIYRLYAPDYPFEFSFLDERFDELYRSETKQQLLLEVFSFIAISIACLGLFGLASYTALKRTKEIGVRKVLGSSVENIVFLLSKDLLRPVLVGTLTALPVGYWVMHRWLEGFAYRTALPWWLFPVSALAAVGVALLTVSTQAIRAALANPIKSLRTE